MYTGQVTKKHNFDGMIWVSFRLSSNASLREKIMDLTGFLGQGAEELFHKS